MQNRKEGTLQINDLYDLPPHLKSATLTDKLEANWFDEIQRNPKKPSLLRATIRTIRWKLLLFGLLLLIQVSLKVSIGISFTMNIDQGLLDIAQPLLVIFLMDFFESCSSMAAWHAWLLAFGTIFIAFMSSILLNQVSVIFFANCYYLS
jgi:hypothetical protein